MRENGGVGLPADAVTFLAFEAVYQSGAGAPVEGSRIVATSTPVRFSVPYRSPGQAHACNLPHVRRQYSCNNQ